jgi:RNA polymerase primary sigma factor
MNGTVAKECVVPNELQTYFQNISQTSLLSSQEERSLAEAIAGGDREARSRMIRANLRLVVKIARDYVGRGLALDDLIGEGNLGLIRAAEDYDPRFGTRFSTYASHWIKQATRHALINTAASIQLPAHMYGMLNRWRRAERSLTRQHGREPSFEEVAVHLGLSDVQRGLVVKARRASHVKLESSLSDEDGAWSADQSTDSREGPDAALQLSDEHAEVLRRMDRLDERERLVLTLRFGLQDELPQTLREIGRRLGVTREWVRKIELRAVGKLVAAAVSRPIGTPPRPAHGRGRPPRSVAPEAATSVSDSTTRPANASHAAPIVRQSRDLPAVSVAKAC